MHHNTTNESESTLKEYNKKVNRQERKILDFFKDQNRRLTPSQVWVNCFDVDDTPLTSVRRGISNLTKVGKLVKTLHKKPGIFGRPEYYWELKLDQQSKLF